MAIFLRRRKVRKQSSIQTTVEFRADIDYANAEGFMRRLFLPVTSSLPLPSSCNSQRFHGKCNAKAAHNKIKGGLPPISLEGREYAVVVKRPCEGSFLFDGWLVRETIYEEPSNGKSPEVRMKRLLSKHVPTYSRLSWLQMQLAFKWQEQPCFMLVRAIVMSIWEYRCNFVTNSVVFKLSILPRWLWLCLAWSCQDATLSSGFIHIGGQIGVRRWDYIDCIRAAWVAQPHTANCGQGFKFEISVSTSTWRCCKLFESGQCKNGDGLRPKTIKLIILLGTSLLTLLQDFWSPNCEGPN